MPTVQSSALFTDRYEYTMATAARASGVGSTDSVFEVFARNLPAGRRYGIVAGIPQVIEAIRAFRFDDPTIAWLLDNGAIDATTARDLEDWRFTGDVWGYPEGDVYFPHSPILGVRAPFAEATLFETVVLSILNHACAVAAAGARMVLEARRSNRAVRLAEFGARRTHSEAAVDAARAAYLVGFDATATLEAGRRHDIPTVGTAAHSFILAHSSEIDAFDAQMTAFGVNTTLLVDTYDIAEGIDAAVTAARRLGAPGPGAIRIDSGDLTDVARFARRHLDDLGANGTTILVSGDIDEFKIAELVAADAPVDAYGIGARLVTGSGAPSAGFVYKLVAIVRDGVMSPVAKVSASKCSSGGIKRARRDRDATGLIRGESFEVLTELDLVGDVTTGGHQVPYLVGGEATDAADDDLTAARTRCADALASLPESARRIDPGAPTFISTETTKEHDHG